MHFATASINAYQFLLEAIAARETGDAEGAKTKLQIARDGANNNEPWTVPFIASDRPLAIVIGRNEPIERE